MAHYRGLEDTASDTVHREQRSASEKGEYRAGLGRLCDRSAPYYYWEDHTLEIVSSGEVEAARVTSTRRGSTSKDSAAGG
jgi:hypothetical protein